MKIFILLGLIASVFAQQYPIIATDSNCGKGTFGYSKLTGGTNAIKGTFGWTVAITENGRLICGGAIVNAIWIITTASCISGKNPSTLTIEAGFQDRNYFDSWSQKKSVEKIIIHSQYQYQSLKNDIAMIKLFSPINIDIFLYRVIPVCIPTGTENYESRNSYITGYGNTIITSQNILKYASQTVLTNFDCRQKFSNIIAINSDTQLCAASYNGDDFCQNDYGGPLVVKGYDGRWHLVGLASFGKVPCGQGGVYTRVSAYTNFIINTMYYN